MRIGHLGISEVTVEQMTSATQVESSAGAAETLRFCGELLPLQGQSLSLPSHVGFDLDIAPGSIWRAGSARK